MSSLFLNIVYLSGVIITPVCACVDVAPRGIPPQPTSVDSPNPLDYQFEVNTFDDTAGVFELYVELQVLKTDFARFELHMEDVESKKTVGQWRTHKEFEGVTKPMPCPGDGAAGVLTNSKPLTGKVVAGIWKADSGYRGNVMPVTTIIKNEKMYWKDIT